MQPAKKAGPESAIGCAAAPLLCGGTRKAAAAVDRLLKRPLPRSDVATLARRRWRIPTPRFFHGRSKGAARPAAAAAARAGRLL